MASNPYVNKVQKADGSVIIDISDTTTVDSDVASGKYFYTASGEKKVGTATIGGSIYQDQDGYLVLSPDGGGGGGGSSDFDIATVTITNTTMNGFECKMPIIFEEDDFQALVTNGYIGTGESEWLIPMYKNMAIIPVLDTIRLASTTGGVEFDSDENWLIVTGDGTVTITA